MTMNEAENNLTSFTVGKLKVEVHPSRDAMGRAAACAAAEALAEMAEGRDSVAAIFATGASQLDTLDALTRMEYLPWDKVHGFHLDEYVGLPADHRASFRNYLRQNLTQKVSMKHFYEIDGTAPDINEVCSRYADKLREHRPGVCLLGIGENGHLAFNDPGAADFDDPEDVKVVRLDEACRRQQVAEGWFAAPEEVPDCAVTLTIPSLMRVPRLIVSVPGPRKAAVIRRTLTEEVSTACPATILRSHPDVTVFLDYDSAAELEGVFAAPQILR